MGVGDFLKSMFTKTIDDNDVNAANLPTLQSRKNSNSNGNGNGNSNTNGTNGKNRANQNNDMDMDSYNSYNANNNSITKYPSTPKTKNGVEDFYVTSEHLPRVTSDNLPTLASNNGKASYNNTSGFTQPIFDLDSFQDSQDSSDPLNSSNSSNSNDKLTSYPNNKTNLTNNEAINEGHILLGKASNIADHILDLLPPTLAIEYKVLPVEIRNNEVAVLFSDTGFRGTAERSIMNRLATKKLKYKVKFYQVGWDVLEPAIHHNYLANLGFDKTNLELDHSWTSSNGNNGNSKTLILDANTKGFDEQQNKYKKLFIDAASIAHNAKATDLDFDLEEDEKTGQTYLVIRINVDGSKVPILNKPTTIKEFRKLGVVMRSISSLDTSNDQDATTGVIRGILAYGSRSSRVELRCNVMPHEEGIMSFSVRIQAPDDFVYTPNNLGMYPEQQELMDRYFVRSVGGLDLFVGPTGSGKNTNQMTFLKERVRLFPGWKTITIEDPVEMRFRGVLQFSVKKDKGYDYFMAAAMRHIPNMIIVGETRDTVTGKLVLEAAESGHFVSTTVHAYDCVTAIARMISLNCDVHKLADSLKMIVAQRLVGKTCTKCIKTTDPIAARIPRLKTFISNLGGNTETEFLVATGKLADGTQCQNCHGTGVKGRVGIFEIMTFTNEMRDLIINRASYKIQELAIKNGMTTLWVNGLRRALTGEVSLSSLERSLGLPDPQREGLELDRSMLSDTDSDIDVSGLN